MINTGEQKIVYYKSQLDKENLVQSALRVNGQDTPIEFTQTCSLQLSHPNQLRITGKADLTKNEKGLRRLCQHKGLPFESIKTVEQHTLYHSPFLPEMPQVIKTNYLVKGHDEEPLLHMQARIDIQLNKE